MTSQNQKNKAMDEAAHASAFAKLLQIRAMIDSLLKLGPNQLDALFHSGQGYGPFIDNAYQVALNHPHILPIDFNADKFVRDYEFARGLRTILDSDKDHARDILGRLITANSNTLTGSLEIYAAVVDNWKMDSNLQIVARDMAAHYNAICSANPPHNASLDNA